MGVFKGKRKRAWYLTSKKRKGSLISPLKKRQKFSSPIKLTPFKSATSQVTSTPTRSLWSISPFRAWPRSCKKEIRFSTEDIYEKNDDEKEDGLDDLSISMRSLDLSEDIEAISYDQKELLDLLPSVLEELGKVGKRDILNKFARVVKDGKLPLTNLALTLFSDVLNWYSTTDTRLMRYSEETINFFWVGQKLFGGRFLRFMSGMKNETEQLTGGSSHCNPASSRINFACPDEKVLRNYNPFGDELPVSFSPGIMKKMIDYKAKRMNESKSFVLMFDGKKVKRGTDVDLLGFEQGLTLKEKQDIRDNDIGIVDALMECINKVQVRTDDVAETPDELKTELLNNLVATNLMLSKHLKELRDVKCNKEYAMKKLKDKVDGDDWRNSKFAFSIDLCRTVIWKIGNVIDKITHIQKCICKTGAFVNQVGHLFSDADVVDLSYQGNLRILKPPEHLPPESGDNFSTVKQRTAKWYEERSKMKVTGSSIYKALGCDGLKRQKEHFLSVMCGKEIPNPTPEQEAAMEHGTLSEVHQIATMCSVVMPFLFPELTFYEEGFYISDQVLVSPDGSLRSSDNPDAKLFAFEGKAPVGNPFKPTLHYRVPERYISQTLFEQKVLRAPQGTIYMCWTSSSCTVFKVLENDAAVNAILEEIQKVYFCTSPKCPTRLSPSAKQLKQCLQDVSNNSTIFLGEFPSVRGQFSKSDSRPDITNASAYVHAEPRLHSIKHLTFTFDEVLRHLLHCREVVTETYEIKRNIASQVVVYLLADLDRLWKEEEPHAIPVAYFFRGYSLSMEVFRKITEACKEACKSRGVDVIVSAADGEFLPLIVRGKTGNPLTQHQLSKDVWVKTAKLSKHEILKRFKQETKDYICTGNKITSRNNTLSKISTPVKGWKQERHDTRHYHLSDDSIVSTDLSGGMLAERLEDNVEVEDSSDQQQDDELPDIHGIEVDAGLMQTDQVDNAPKETALSLSEDMVKEFLDILRNADERKWGLVTSCDLSNYFQTQESLNRFTMKELVLVTKLINSKRKQNENRLKTTGVKKTIIEQLMMGPSKVEDTYRKRRQKSVPSLQVLSSRILMKKSYPKKVLNIAFCNFIWDERVRKWRNDAKVDGRISIFGLEDDLEPYYVPDSDNFEIGVYDKTHLGTNLRKALCLDKIDGISKQAWVRVSEEVPSILNPALIEVAEDGKIIDQMKEKLARSLFTENIEAQMVKNDNHIEASFCRIIRESLYVADDAPGIPAIDRCRKRMDLIKWLKDGVDFGDFPPFGARIKGLSYILYEGLRTSNEAKLYLYALSKQGTYCVRAPNTLCSESFFSTMQEMDPWGQGVLTAEGVEKHISDFTTITALKMQEDRTFYIRTKKDAAYPMVSVEADDKRLHAEDAEKRKSQVIPKCSCRDDGWIKCIVPRDHFFDTKFRARRSKGVKPFQFSDVDAPARGDLPIRAQYGYRVNEAKILPSKRLGLNPNNLQ